MSIVFQVVRGVMLVIHYDALHRYDSIIYIMLEVNYGWFVKLFHRNNARVIFLALFFHLYKNIRMSRYRLTKVWHSGLLIIVIIIAAAFSGYVLVGSQMRFWAAMVITSLIRVLPYGGENLMYFVWGGFRISGETLQLLFVLHYMVPFAVLVVIIIHLDFLHRTGRTRVIFRHSRVLKVMFFPFYWVKDIINLVLYWIFLVLILLYPYSMGEVELFDEANPLVSPIHIVPEWYFLVRYAILRSVPRKPIGVLVIGFSIGVLFMYPYRIRYVTPITRLSRSVVVVMLGIQLYLRYLGFSPISQPFVLLALIGCVMYFFTHIFIITVNLLATHCFVGRLRVERPRDLRNNMSPTHTAGLFTSVRLFRSSGKPKKSSRRSVSPAKSEKSRAFTPDEWDKVKEDWRGPAPKQPVIRPTSLRGLWAWIKFLVHWVLYHGQ